MMICHFKM